MKFLISSDFNISFELVEAPDRATAEEYILNPDNPLLDIQVLGSSDNMVYDDLDEHEYETLYIEDYQGEEK